MPLPDQFRGKRVVTQTTAAIHSGGSGGNVKYLHKMVHPRSHIKQYKEWKKQLRVSSCGLVDNLIRTDLLSTWRHDVTPETFLEQTGSVFLLITHRCL